MGSLEMTNWLVDGADLSQGAFFKKNSQIPHKLQASPLLVAASFGEEKDWGHLLQYKVQVDALLPINIRISQTWKFLGISAIYFNFNLLKENPTVQVKNPTLTGKLVFWWGGGGGQEFR